MAQENRLTLQDRAALITVIVLVLTTVAGFVYTLVSGTEQRVIEAIKSVDNKVEKVDAKLEKHIDFHMTNKLQCKKEDVTNAEEEDTEETSTTRGEEKEREQNEKRYAKTKKKGGCNG